MENINYFLVFIEGILSFVSPCILPILPVYLTILAGSGNEVRGGKVLLRNTILFMLGISTTFFILGTSMSLLNQFIFVNKQLILFVGGILIILLGIFYMGYLKIPFLQRERKFHMEIKEMKPWTAYLLGFTFSFGWTPCIGPMLASVLMMASGASTVGVGNVLIALYSIGFMLPFVVIALAYKKIYKILDKLKLHMGTIQKFGGVILIISGLIMTLGGATDVRTSINKFFSEVGNRVEQPQSEQNIESEKVEEEQKVLAPDFSLVDQYGNTHTLSDYEGKVVFLNFWATWCPPCKEEMPFIEEIYNEYGKNSEDVVILGVAMPNLGREGSKEHIMEFLEDEGYTFPVVFDEDGMVANAYYISAFPTTFIIEKDGSVKGYVPGGLPKESMEYLIEDAR